MIGLHVSLLGGAKDVANTGGGVPNWRVAQTLIVIGGHLAIAQDFSIVPMNLGILIIVGGILLHVGGLRFTAGLLIIFSGPGVGGT